MLIKTRNFSLNKDKMEGTFDKGDGLGWAPGYNKKFEGRRTPKAIKNFSDNYDKIKWRRQKR